MKIFLKTGFVIVLFVCSFLKSEAQGRDVTVIFKNGKQFGGELLSVRLTALSVLRKSVDKDEEIAAHPEIVEVALINEIESVRLEKVAPKAGYALPAALTLGGILGGIGLLSDLNTPKGESQFSSAGLGVICGGVLGLVVGNMAASHSAKDEERIYPNSTKELMIIRSHARFDGDEPSYVRDIIDNLLKETK